MPTPESLGIPSRAVLNLLERIDRERVNMHGFLLLRRGEVAAEGYWAPYTAETRHRMYSVSKSFVSLAVGLMVDDGKISLDDPVARFFPDKLPKNPHPYVADATVRDLLTMATPHSRTSYTRDDRDWAWTFFNTAPSHPPGTIFSYDTAATVVLGSIVERIAGVPFLEFMRPRMLDPIGFSSDAYCIETPEGTSWGGSGVICTLRDMANVALLCLQHGRWDGKQLISEEYVRAATAKQIDNSIGGNVGYGYQIWRERENGFGFRGMGTQLAMCFPDKDFIFACISDTQGAGPTGTGVVGAMWDELHAELADEPLAEDPAAHAALTDRIARLAVLPVDGAATSRVRDSIAGAWYTIEPNPMGISRMRFTFEPGAGTWEYTNAQGDKTLRFGLGRVVAGVFPQTGYYRERIGTPSDRPYDCLASAAWVDERTLNLSVSITDTYLGSLKASFVFKGDEIGVYMTKTAEWFLEEYEGFAGGRK